MLPRDLALAWTGTSTPAEAIAALWRSDRAAVVVTAGGDGCWYRARDEGPDSPVRHQPATPVVVVDTTGCGDVFHGVYAASLSRGRRISGCIADATAAAAACATHPGGIAPRPATSRAGRQPLVAPPPVAQRSGPSPPTRSTSSGRRTAMKRPRLRLLTLTATAASLCLVATACGGAGSAPGSSSSDSAGGGTLRVLLANNPQMEPLRELTTQFEQETGTKVTYTTLPENDLRDKVNQEYSSQAGQYDLTSLSAFEVPIFSKNGWMAPLTDYVAADPDFDQADIFPAFTSGLTGPDGKLYGEPFYGESSFMMYRKDVFEKKGLTMPEKPDVGPDRRPRGQGRRRRAGHGRHLPARHGGLGPEPGPAQHRDQHLRRPVVRHGLGRAS